MITQERLKQLLRYDPDTGIFYWRVTRRWTAMIGDVAGHKTSAGYVRITVDKRRYMAHVLAWLYMTGEYLYKEIDHENSNRSDNRWENLRRANSVQNCHNQSLRSDNALGVKGVCKRKGAIARPYVAQITIEKKQRELGRFASMEEAKAAYDAAAVKYFGEFARLA